MASQSHYTSEESRRKTRRLTVYDDVVGVLNEHDANGVHDVQHGITWIDYDIVKVILSGFGDGVAEALVKDHGFKFHEEGGDIILRRFIK